MLQLYEPLLPYAVVFGQEKQWADRLAVLYDSTGTPGWYVGTSGFSAASFASGIGSLSASATSASSTSGGSSGGGSAGGGGGGGGGGGVYLVVLALHGVRSGDQTSELQSLI